MNLHKKFKKETKNRLQITNARKVSLLLSLENFAKLKNSTCFRIIKEILKEILKGSQHLKSFGVP